MRRRRFKVEALTESVISVTGREADHALRVLRLVIGDAVVLFDGDGREMDGRIRAISRERFEVEPTGKVREGEVQRSSLTIATATPKGQRSDWLVEKCAELGVSALWLLETERGPVIPGEGKLDRWRRKAVAAAKQAGHARVMSIEPPRPIDALDEVSKTFVSVFHGDPSADATPLIDELKVRPQKSCGTGFQPVHDTGCDPESGNVDGAENGFSAQHEILIFIGPEGGFTSEERKEIERLGGRPVSLGDATLRIETAAIAAAAIWANSCE